MAESRFRIGYALAQKKQYSFIQPSLVDLASQRGIDLVPIDVEKPLSSQGPFHCLLHKMPGDDWKNKINDYLAANPTALVIDHPDDIERLHNRISMLDVVAEMEKESFGIPKQVVIYDTDMLMDSNAFPEGLMFPVIAKPLVADGSAKSHKMSLVFNREGLAKLKPPIVLQEFVNHGGVIFKAYVVGDHVRCVKRNSLPDVPEENRACSRLESSMSFSQISNLPSHDKNYSTSDLLEAAEMPPSKLIDEIAVGLRKATRLHLFNFDVIRDARVGNRYLVIDINYFPGYAKMPEYETVLTDFFCDMLSNKEKD